MSIVFTPFPWHDRGEAGNTPVDRHDLQTAEEALAGWVNTNFLPASGGGGEDQTVFTPVVGAQFQKIAIGSAASPDTLYSPGVHISRTLSVAETAFSGDGSAGLAGLNVTTKATATSQGQAIGVSGGAVTDSTYVGAHSQADAVGGYFVGRSSALSTRAGIGFFASGRRENAAGITTGAEITSDNSTLTAGVFEPAGASLTKGIWLHATGLTDSGVGLQVGNPFGVKFQVAFGINENSVSKAVYQDHSSAEWSIRIKGAHLKAAIAVAAKAGQVVIGAEEPDATTQLLQVFVSETEHADPAVVIGSGNAIAHSTQFKNVNGNLKVFVANGANNFLTGTVAGDTGLAFTPSKTFHIGPQTKESLFRMQEKAMAFFGATPVVRPEVTLATVTATILAEKLNLLGLIKTI